MALAGSLVDGVVVHSTRSHHCSGIASPHCHRCEVSGTSSLRKWVKNRILAILFPDSFLTILLQTCLDADGRPYPQSRKLLQWLLDYIYANRYDWLYEDWLQCKDGADGAVEPDTR